MKSDSLFKCFSNLIRSADYVERVLVVDIFVWWFFPAKIVWVKIVSCFHHCHSNAYRLEYISIRYVYMHSAACHSRMLLICWLKRAGAKANPLKLQCIQIVRILIWIYVRRAD